MKDQNPLEKLNPNLVRILMEMFQIEEKLTILIPKPIRYRIRIKIVKSILQLELVKLINNKGKGKVLT